VGRPPPATGKGWPWWSARWGAGASSTGRWIPLPLDGRCAPPSALRFTSNLLPRRESIPSSDPPPRRRPAQQRGARQALPWATGPTQKDVLAAFVVKAHVSMPFWAIYTEANKLRPAPMEWEVAASGGLQGPTKTTTVRTILFCLFNAFLDSVVSLATLLIIFVYRGGLFLEGQLGRGLSRHFTGTGGLGS
jgi:hypothetical protein